MVLLVAALLPETALAQSLNGFDLSGALIPVDEILSGGPTRDGIPAIDAPAFVTASQAGFLADAGRVLGLKRNGVAKAYPIAILNWHEVVNDRFGDEPVVITYCPLCGSGIAFLADIDSRPRAFGVSGLLYNSDVLLYDRQSESLWSQIMMQAVSGPQRGATLTPVPLAHTSWADWRSRHPETLVLSTDTGFHRDYDRDPYLGYAGSNRLFFPVTGTDPRYQPKDWVIGIGINGRYKAYPFRELAKTGGVITDTVGGKTVHVQYSARHQSATIADESGNALTGITAFWFAWYTFHPDTAVFRLPEGDRAR
ncbi:MAG: hypothetical protein FD165_2123 [Gammaproteobacteria bacterium]|nr:MAG: hypothetical protein FD165_2123 [Gammaproteobacteria bacterium]TND05282.1 MAG: hypothetical protein FD120_1157 [Gammaproteobacteria bacterium]